MSRPQLSLFSFDMNFPTDDAGYGNLSIGLLLLIPLLSLCASGQNNGVPTFATVEDHGIDAINLQNLDVLISPPVRDKAGAIPFHFGLTGISNCTIIPHTDAAGDTFNYMACGTSPQKSWAQNVPSIISEDSGLLTATAKYTISTSATCSNGTGTTKYSSWVIQDSRFGTTHALPTADYVDSAQCLNGSFTDAATDNSGYTLAVTSGGSADTIYTSSGLSVSTSSNVTTVTDTNGNTESLNSVAPEVITDTLGTTALTFLISTGSSTNGNYSWKDINGNTQTISQTYGTLNIDNAFGCGAKLVNWIGATVTSGITYPDGNIAFTYEANGNTGYYTGRIHQITYKTGGTVTYTYSGGSNGLDCTYLVPPQMSRITQDGTTTYTWTLVNNSNGNYGNTTTVLDPGKNKTVYTFTGLSSSGKAPYPTMQALTQVQKYQNTGTVSVPVYTLLTTDVICYNGVTIGCPTAVVSYPIKEKDVYHTVAGMSQSSRTQIKYDGYGNITVVAKYDFGATSFTYQTTTSYGSWNGSQCVAVGNNINNRPCDVLTTDGTNSLAEFRYTYDSHGNLLTNSKWTGARWLNSSATYNANGTAKTATDVNGTQTTFSYAATGSGGCNGLLLTGAKTVVSTGDTLTTSQTWDSSCNGAVPLTSTDANGNVTQYAHNDPYYRLTSSTDPLGYAKTITYTSPTSINSHASFGSSVDDVTAYLDGLGRPILAQRQEALGSSNYDSVSSSYVWNGTAFQKGTSMPCVKTQGAGCSSYFASSTIDPLGRTLSAQDAGGGTITNTYSQNDVKISVGPAPAGEKTKNVQTEYDGLGRPKSLCQILSSGGSSCGQSTAASGYLTSYAYLTLAGATKKTSTRGVQTRTSIYDALGRPTSQTNPESGTVSSVYDTETSCGPNGSYTSNGDLLKITDARSVSTCYTYDPLHRVTDVNNSAQSTSACKRFRYDNTTGVLGAIPTGVTASNTLGRMAEAETDTCASPITQSSIITDEWFSYDKDGRLTDVYELTPNSGGYYHTTVGYFSNGVVSSLSGLPGYAAYSYTVDGEGRPNTAVQGTTTLINGVTFNAASQPTLVKIGQFDQDTYTYDPATGRMTNYTFSVNSGSESGALTWNANGSLRQLAITDGFNSGGTQTCNFGTSSVMGYDDLGRLLSDNCGSVWSQTFSYDQYDNVTKSGNITWNPGYNSANNRYTLAGTSYDAAGNLLYDSFNTYTWDAYGKMTTVTSGQGTVVCGTSGFCVTYDAFGRAVERNYQGTYKQILYSPLGKTAVMTGQTVTNAYVPLPGGESSMYANSTGGSGHYMEHHDWRGSVVLSSSLINRTVDYDRAFAAFGEMYDNFGVTTKLNFTGDTQDIFAASPGLYDTPNRELHTTQGRWISPDSAGAGWNQYGYVSNNPLGLTDPSGLCPSCDEPHYEVFDAAGSADDGCYLTFSCTAYVDEFGMQLDSQFAQAALQNGSGAKCPQCVATNVPGAGWAFPSLGADDSISWAFSFSADYVGSNGNVRPMNPEWIAEVLGLAVSNPSVSSDPDQLRPGQVIEPISIHIRMKDPFLVSCASGQKQNASIEIDYAKSIENISVFNVTDGLQLSGRPTAIGPLGSTGMQQNGTFTYYQYFYTTTGGFMTWSISGTTQNNSPFRAYAREDIQCQ